MFENMRARKQVLFQYPNVSGVKNLQKELFKGSWMKSMNKKVQWIKNVDDFEWKRRWVLGGALRKLVTVGSRTTN